MSHLRLQPQRYLAAPVAERYLGYINTAIASGLNLISKCQTRDMIRLHYQKQASENDSGHL